MKPAKGPFYKVLDPGRKPPYQGWYRWPLPGTATEPVKGRLVMCQNGYHIATRKQLLDYWLSLGVKVWLAKPHGPVMTDGFKCVCRSATLVRQVGSWTSKKRAQWRRAGGKKSQWKIMRGGAS